jgi:hypothetical protein
VAVRGEKPWPSAGTFRGRPWGIVVSIPGEFRWPPVGSSRWPLTPDVGVHPLGPVDPDLYRPVVVLPPFLECRHAREGSSEPRAKADRFGGEPVEIWRDQHPDPGREPCNLPFPSHSGQLASPQARQLPPRQATNLLSPRPPHQVAPVALVWSAGPLTPDSPPKTLLHQRFLASRFPPLPTNRPPACPVSRVCVSGWPAAGPWAPFSGPLRPGVGPFACSPSIWS